MILYRALVAEVLEGRGIDEDPARTVQYVYRDDTLTLLCRYDAWEEHERRTHEREQAQRDGFRVAEGH